MFQTVISGIVDEFPKYLANRKVLLTAILCVVEFLLGVPCITKGGIYFLQIMDWYSSTFSLMILSLTECLVVGWIYGVDRYYADIELMIGYKPNKIFQYAWKFVTPLTIMFVLGFTICNHSPVTYGKYSYPEWALVIGWFFALCSIVPLPLVAIIGILKGKGTFTERVKDLLKPSPRWGPALDMYREQYIATLKGEQRDRVWPSASSQEPLFTKIHLVEKSVSGIPPNKEALISPTDAANAVV